MKNPCASKSAPSRRTPILSRYVFDLQNRHRRETAKIKNLRQAERYLPDNIYNRIDLFEKAEWTTNSSAPTSKAATPI